MVTAGTAQGGTTGSKDALIASALPQLSWHGDSQNCMPHRHEISMCKKRLRRQGAGEGTTPAAVPSPGA